MAWRGDSVKKILCNNSELPRVFAHLLDDGTIDIVRQDQRFTIIGESFTLIGTNPQGEGKTILDVVGGKLQDEEINFKEEEKDGNQEIKPEANDPDGQPDIGADAGSDTGSK